MNGTQPLADAAASLPAALGPYRIVRLLGTGGMGEVFLAERRGPGGYAKRVAIKRLSRAQKLDDDARRSLMTEARIASSLSHPNLVQVFEFDELDGEYVLSMEYVPGASLRELRAAWEARGGLPWELSAYVCAQALHGLQAAHELKDEQGALLGLVHRDVSPENILLGENGDVKVSDFGIAKLVNVTQPQTAVIRGKPAYAAPEHLRGQLLDRRADLYSMGVVLEELLRSAASAPHALRAAVARAIEPRVEDRFESAQEMAKALELVLAVSPGAGTREGLAQVVQGLPVRAAPPRTRHRSRTWASLLVLLAGVGAGGYVLRNRGKQERVAVPPAPSVVVAVPEPVPVEEPAPREPVKLETPAPPKRSHKPALISFRAYPWAEVYLDGKLVGTTPMAPVPVEPGIHQVTFVQSKLGQKQTRKVRARAGQTEVLKVDFAR